MKYIIYLFTIILINIMLSTLSFATVGTVYNSPENGTVRIEDNSGNITFSTGWTSYANANPSGNNHTYITQNGAYLEFTFTGTFFRIICSVNTTACASIKVDIDGVYDSSFTSRATTSYRQSRYEKTLADGTHTIRLTTNDEYTFRFDAVDVISTLPTPTPTPTNTPTPTPTNTPTPTPTNTPTPTPTDVPTPTPTPTDVPTPTPTDIPTPTPTNTPSPTPTASPTPTPSPTPIPSPTPTPTPLPTVIPTDNKEILMLDINNNIKYFSIVILAVLILTLWYKEGRL